MSSFAKLLRRADIFGAPVKFYYKGEPTFKTKLRGCLTILLFIVMVTYLVQIVAQILFQGSKFNQLN